VTTPSSVRSRATPHEAPRPEGVGPRTAYGAVAIASLLLVAVRWPQVHLHLAAVHLPSIVFLTLGLAAAGVALRPTPTASSAEGPIRPAVVAGLVAAYLVAWAGAVLMLDAAFWDDWTLVDVPTEPMLEGFRQNGLPWVGQLHRALLELGPWAYRVVGALAFAGVGAAVLGIVRRLPVLPGLPAPTARDGWLLAALVLVLPFNSARHALITLPYTLSLALFTTAWWLLVRRTPASTATALTATVLLFASFTTQSLLVFVALPVGHLLLLELADDRRPSQAVRWAGRRWYLLAAPVVFYAAKNAWFAPYGLYEGYNQIEPSGLAFATLRVVGLALVLAVVVRLRDRLPPALRASAAWVVGGLLVVAVGELPYLAAGHHPGFDGWNSRHQLLVPFGWATVGVGLVRLTSAALGDVPGRRLATAGVVVAASTSLALTLSFVVDHRKQGDVVALLEEHPEVGDVASVVVRDHTRGLNANQRRWAFYEYNGLFARAYGDTGRFVVPEGSYVVRLRDGDLDHVRIPRYQAGGSRPSDEAVHVRIVQHDSGPRPLWPYRDLRLVITVEPIRLSDYDEDGNRPAP
jgi:hypothetical protein